MSKFLVVREYNNSPIILEVVSETSLTYITNEVYSLNLRDLSPASMRRRVVRWCKDKKCRAGERIDAAQFKIEEILTKAEIEEKYKDCIIL